MKAKRNRTLKCHPAVYEETHDIVGSRSSKELWVQVAVKAISS